MSKQNPAYRGIYGYDEAKKPNGTTVKADPKYRGIYSYDVDRAPDGNPGTAPLPPDNT